MISFAVMENRVHTDLNRRMKRVENELLIWRGATLAAVAVLLLGAVPGGHAGPFKLTSDDGRAEVTLGTDRLVFRREGKEVLALLATEKLAAVKVGVDGADEALLSSEGAIFRSHGVNRVGLLSQGERQNRGLAVYDDKGAMRAGLVLSTKGQPSLLIYGQDPDALLTASVDEKTGDEYIGLTRGKGRPSVLVKNGSEWSGFMTMNGSGTEATLFMAPTGTSGLRLSNDDGKKLEQAPGKRP